MTEQGKAAGLAWRDTRQIVGDGGGVGILPYHIFWMLGGNKWKVPVWQEREQPPDGKTFETPNFEQYLLREPREGLGMPSLLAVNNICEADPDYGDRALNLLEEHIDDYDLKIKKDRRKIQNKRPKLVLPGGDRISVGSQGNNVTLTTRGNKSDYLARRLKRDSPLVWLEYMDGKFRSLRQACLKAGIVELRATVPRAMPLDELAAQLARRYKRKGVRELITLLRREVGLAENSGAASRRTQKL